MQGTNFTQIPGRLEGIDPNAMTEALSNARKKPGMEVASPALQPVVGAAGPPQSASWTSSKTNPRATWTQACLTGVGNELTYVLDLWEQATTRTAGKKLRAYMERQVDRLGWIWVCKALAMAYASHQKLGVGLVGRFRTLCDDVVPTLIAEAEERRLAALEAEQERRQAQWEADAPKRELAAEAKRKSREEMEAIFGKKPFKKKSTRRW